MTKKIDFFDNNVGLQGISANGSLGSAGMVLKSDGTNVYWGTDAASGGDAATLDGYDSSAFAILASANKFTQPITVNLNPLTTGPSLPAGTLLHLIGNNATQSRMFLDVFGSNAAFLGRRANGTNASPSAILLGDIIFSFGGVGYGTTGYLAPASALGLVTATENFTDAAAGAKFSFRTIANGTITPAVRWNIDNDGSFRSELTPALTGNGTINAVDYFDDGVNINTIYASLAATNTFTGNLIVNKSGVAVPTAFGSDEIRIVGATGNDALFWADSFGGPPVFGGRRAEGVPGTPTAVQSGNTLVALRGYGYGTSAYSASHRGSVSVIASENWTNTAQGTRIILATTPNAGATQSARWLVENDGSFIFSGGSLTGNGTINANDYFDNGTNINAIYASLSGATFTGGVTISRAWVAQHTFLTATSVFPISGSRSLTLASPTTDSASEPFIISTGNSLDFHIDSISRLLINSSGNFIFTPLSAFSVTMAGIPTFTNTTDAANNYGLYLDSDRATPTAADSVSLGMRVSSSTGVQREIATIRALATVVTNAAETSRIDFSTILSGTLAQRMTLNATSLVPYTNDSAALGTTANMWSDLFLASGGVINFNNEDVTVTHSTNTLTFAGASSGYSFDGPIVSTYYTDNVVGQFRWGGVTGGYAMLTADGSTNAIMARNAYYDTTAATYKIYGNSAGGWGMIRVGGNTLDFSGAAGSVTGGTSITPTWYTVWHSGNDGSASGLDADLLDGYDSLVLAYGGRAQRLLNGGGTITVDASGYVLWSNRFIVISGGRGTTTATTGYFDINCPTSGTITGVGGATDVTATAAGIPLSSWQALYYILPIGSTNTSIAANFRVVSYTSNVDIPEHWVLICVRNGDSSIFYFNNGIQLGLNDTYTVGTVWNSGNDGAGSGLDADLWDGNQFATYIDQALLTTSTPRFSWIHIGTDTDLRIYESSTNVMTLRAGTTGTETYLTIGASGVLQLNGVAIPTISSSDTLSNKTLSSPLLSGQTVANNTSAGVSTTPFILRNASSTASTEVVLQFNPASVTTRFAEIASRNDGINNTGLILRTGSGGTLTDAISITGPGVVTLSSGAVIPSPALSGTISGTPTYSGIPIFSAGLTTGTTNTVTIGTDGNIEIYRAAGFAFIDFKNASGDDYDIRIQQSGANSMDFIASGGLTHNSVAIPTISSVHTFTNKTFDSGSFTGTIGGSPTFSGQPTFNLDIILGRTTGTNIIYYGAGSTFAIALSGTGNALTIDGSRVVNFPIAPTFTDAATTRTNLGLAIGTNVQAYDADLSSWALITRAAGFDTFVATPSGANFAALLTTALPVSKGGTNATAAGITAFNNITGYTAAGATGTTSTNLVFSTSPTLVTPVLGAATATSINGLTLTSSTGTLSITNAKTFSVTNTLTLSGTDTSTLNIGGGGTLGTAAYQNTGTSGATIPFLNGTNTWSGAQTFLASGAATTLVIGGAVDFVPALRLTSNAGQDRRINFFSGSTIRWSFLVSNAAESGSNAGSNFSIQRFDDAGTFIDQPFAIARNTGGITLAAATTISTTGTGALLSVTSSDAGATAHGIDIFRNSASPAVNDVVGQVRFLGKDSGATTISYGRVYTTIADPTAGSLDSSMLFDTYTNNASYTPLTLGISTLEHRFTTPTDSIVTSQGTNGYGAFNARGSGTNPAYMFFGNVTNSERGRIWVTDGRVLSFSTNSGVTAHLAISSAGVLTASGNTIWHAGNDGDASGLDADLWNGYARPSYLNQAVLTTSTPTFGGLNLTSSTSFLPQAVITNTNNDANAGYVIFFKTPADTLVSANDYLGTILWYGQGTSTNQGTAATIYARAEGTRGTNWVASNLVLGAISTTGSYRYLALNADGTITWNSNTVWHSGNHGPGSGLNADLLDNLNSAQLLRSDLAQQGGVSYATHDFNTYPSVYSVSFVNPTGSSNLPTGMTSVLSYRFIMAGGDTTARGVDLVAAAEGSGNLYFRERSLGTWNKFWHNNNDGDGSGLDADLWNGWARTSYLNQAVLTSSSPSFAGLTMTGLLIGLSSASTDVNTANDTGSFSARGNTTTVASMSFHRTGAYAINMGLGTDNVFRIGGWSAANNCLQLDGSGNLTALSNISAYSDVNLKEDFIVIECAVDKVSKLTGYTYTRKDTKERNTGLVAQEVEAVLPEAVSEIDGVKTLAYGNLMGLMVEAIKELKAEIEELKNGNA